ncbi:hypothetical protein MPH_10431 [Macrophomina phaseolina MS6]|uniref:Secreted protein n=1 Tax=Macrophomina phaseolina (strain MS6) TaxID=1126212 RepID=K2RQL2_MACPH|nr:hypothetical protein MPH_10431 [Macrophomina phaseolina MS6]
MACRVRLGGCLVFFFFFFNVAPSAFRRWGDGVYAQYKFHTSSCLPGPEQDVCAVRMTRIRIVSPNLIPKGQSPKQRSVIEDNLRVDMLHAYWHGRSVQVSSGRCRFQGAVMNTPKSSASPRDSANYARAREHLAAGWSLLNSVE